MSCTKILPAAVFKWWHFCTLIRFFPENSIVMMYYIVYLYLKEIQNFYTVFMNYIVQTTY